MSKRKKSSGKFTNDKIYHALGHKYPRLLLATTNEAHRTNYTGEEKVLFDSDEHYPKELIVHIKAPGGQLRYKIPTLKAFHYTMKELLERGLFLFMPFHILVYKNRILSYNKNEKGLLTLAQAAAQLGMSEEEFAAKIS